MTRIVPLRIDPATSIVHLEINAGEDVEIDLDVLSDDDELVPLTAAVATIGRSGTPALHTFSGAGGNLTVGPDPGRVRLAISAADSTGWHAAWTNSEWQLDVTDIFARTKRAAEGDFRVRGTRRRTS